MRTSLARDHLIREQAIRVLRDVFRCESDQLGVLVVQEDDEWTEEEDDIWPLPGVRDGTGAHLPARVHAAGMADVRETAAGEDLRSLLQPWLTPGFDVAGGFRFHDAPPDQVRRALDSIDATWGTARFNGQPPADWLVNTAERLGGRLAGQVGNDTRLPQRLRVDAIAVPSDRARELAYAVEDGWPQITFGDTALGLALAEAWTAWDAEAAFWTGNGRDLLTAPPDAAAVIGLWWD